MNYFVTIRPHMPNPIRVRLSEDLEHPQHVLAEYTLHGDPLRLRIDRGYVFPDDIWRVYHDLGASNPGRRITTLGIVMAFLFGGDRVWRPNELIDGDAVLAWVCEAGRGKHRIIPSSSSSSSSSSPPVEL